MIVEYNKGEPLTFRHEALDAHGSESFMLLYATDSEGNVVGKIDYTIYENVISISMIKTVQSEFRKGIATEMAKELQREYPESEIKWGMTTTPGQKFLKSLSRRYIPNEEYIEAKKKLEIAKANQAKMQKIYDSWYDLAEKDKEKALSLKPKIAAMNDQFNSNEEIIFELGRLLGTLSPGKWMINI
jgi:hypothetical protein